jgi:lipopolysaccharide export system protein LptA
MDYSCLWARSCLIALAILPLAPASAILPESQEPISLDAAAAEFDGPQNRLVFDNVRITQGPLTITADRAIVDALDFANNTWLFTGDVRIDGGPTRIRSDAASLLFVEHRLVSASVTGDPATFERDAVDDRRAISGGAAVIEYDAREGTLVLAQHAQLYDGTNEITGERLLYKVAEDRLIASSDASNGERVRVTITPQTVEPREPPEDGEPSTEPGPPDDEAGTDNEQDGTR